MRSIATTITKFNRFLFESAKWLVVLITLLMLYEVISRYSLHSPTSWAPELAALLFGPFFLLGGPYLLHLGGHVSVDLISARTNGKLDRLFMIIASLLAIAFGSILLWFACPLALQSFEYRETSYSTWNPPVWPAKLVLPIVAALLILQACRTCKYFFRREAPLMNSSAILLGMFISLVALMLTGAPLAFVLGAIAFLTTIIAWGPSGLIVMVLNTFEIMDFRGTDGNSTLRFNGINITEIGNY